MECGAYAADLPLWRRLARELATNRDDRCEVLDLGCGTGRVSLALAGAQCGVTALDSEDSFVEELRRRAQARGSKLQALVGDASSFSLKERFDLVLAPMQLVQLLPDRGTRRAMLACAARHLRPSGRIAVALMQLEEEWSASEAAAPMPDMLERDGWVYSSQPVAVNGDGDGAIVLERVRRRVSPSGEIEEGFSSIRLALVEPGELEDDLRAAGLTIEPRRRVAATRDHVGSVVIASAPASGEDG